MIGADGMRSPFADAVGAAGRRPLADALVDYEKRRNESAMARFEWACRSAEMRPVSQKMLTLLGALKGNQEDTNRFMGLTGGTVLSTEFFQADNLARIMARLTPAT